MVLRVVTEPTVEPISASEAKEHMRIDSNAYVDDVSESQSIIPASYTTGTSTGSGVDVLGYNSVVNVNVGAVAAGATLVAHIEESDDNTTFSDVAGSTFSLSTSNQNSISEKAYTGVKQYVRAIGVVAGGDVVYGATVVKDAPTAADDDYIESLVVAARQIVESYLGRRLINSVWDYYTTEFPSDSDNIKIPYPNLVSVTSLKYTDKDGTENTMSTGDYIVDTYSEPGRVVLGYGESWPSDTLYPSNPIAIRHTAGYGATSTSVPKAIKQAVMMLTDELYRNRGLTTKDIVNDMPMAIRCLLQPYRVWDEVW